MTSADVQYLDQKFSLLFETVISLIEENSKKIDKNSKRLEENSKKIDENSRKIDKCLEILDRTLLRMTSLEDENKATFAWLRRHDKLISQSAA